MVEQPASPFLELYETQLRSKSRAVLPGEHRIHGKLDGDLEWSEIPGFALVSQGTLAKSTNLADYPVSHLRHLESWNGYP